MYYLKLIPNGASVKPAARRARQFALQAIYSWQITKENVATIEEQFCLATNTMKKNFVHLSQHLLLQKQTLLTSVNY